MPDLKTTQLTADSSPANADLLVTAKSPFGAGSNRKVLVSDMATKIQSTVDLPKVILNTTSNALANTALNSGGFRINIPIDNTDTNFHSYYFAVASNDLFALQAEGDGTGEITNELAQINAATSIKGAGDIEGDMLTVSQIDAPTFDPTVALVSPAAPGNVDNGTHYYGMTYMCPGRETSLSPGLASVVVTNKTINGQVKLSLFSTSPDSELPIESVNLFRTTAADPTTFYFLQNVAIDNTNTAIYIDNISDAVLVAQNKAPLYNHTGILKVDGGDLVASGRSSFGSEATTEQLGTFFTFSQTVTDPQEVSTVKLLNVDNIVAPTGPNALSSTVNGADFNLSVPDTNTKDFTGSTLYGNRNTLTYGGSSDIANLKTNRITNANNSSGSILLQEGLEMEVIHNGSGTVTNMVSSLYHILNSSGNVTNSTHLELRTAILSTGRIGTQKYINIKVPSQPATTFYGIYGEDVSSSGATSYFIYSAGGANYFGGEVQMGGGQKIHRTAVSGDYSILSADYLLGVSTAAPRTLTLPSAATVGVGKIYVIKDETGTAATNNITIATTGGQTIDGSASVIINTNYAAVSVYTDGTNWFIY